MKRITVSIDLEAQPSRVLAAAKELGAATKADIHVLATLRPHTGLLRRNHGEEERINEQLGQLERLCKDALGSRSGGNVFIHARWGDPAEEVVRLAAECDADLIVLGAFGVQGDPLAVATSVLKWAACSVHVVEPNREDEQKGGLVPHFAVCVECEQERKDRGGNWFCKNHHNPTVHAFRMLPAP